MMFIQIEETPNPQTLKFLPGFQIMNSGETLDLPKSDDKASVGLAGVLFRIDGVERVFFGHDFISVTKSDSLEWSVLKPEVLMEIMEYFAKHERAVDEVIDGGEEEEFFDPADLEIVNKIKELIENYVRPAVAQDGGDIRFRGYEKGAVFVKLKGACSGCPSASVTLKQGVHNMLSYHVPEVISVEDVQ